MKYYILALPLIEQLEHLIPTTLSAVIATAHQQSRVEPLNMPRPLNTREPPHPALDEALRPGLKLVLSEVEVVDGPDAQDAHPGVSRRHAVPSTC